MSYCGSWGWGWGSRYGNYWGRSYYHHRRYDKVNARNDAVTVDEDGTATINVLDNDTSRKGKALHVEQFAGVWAGRTTTVESSDGRSATVTLNRDGTLTIEPGDDFNDLNAGETDTVTIWYKASNGRGKSDWAKVTVTIEGENEQVVIELTNDAVSTGEAEDVTINVLDNDTGAEAVTSVSFGGETFEVGQSFTVTSADGRTGTVTVEADGTLTFTGDGNFEDLNDGETDTVTVTYTVGGEGTPARVIDFEGLNRGEVVSDQFDGVTITAQRRWQNDNSPNDAMIFDSNNPTGGDWDLRTSTQDNILIISENNNSWNPDDNRHGGTITFDFDEAENVDALTFIDTERAATVRLTQEDGNVVTLHGPVTANGGVATLSIGVTSVVLMEVILAGSGAIDDLELGAKAGDAQTAEVVITIEGEGSPLAIEDDAFNLFENDSLNGNILDNDIAEGDLIVSSFSGLAAGETAEVVSADGRTGFITVGEDGSISFTADGDFETLAVGDSDTITFSYTASTVGGPGENLIINGDFENNPLNNSGWTAVESIQGWSSPVGHVEIQESNFGTGNTQGNAVVELDAHFNSTIEQTVSIEDAGTYTLSVDYASRGSNFGTNGFDILVDGEVVSSVRPSRTGFQNETVEIELDAGDAVLQFRAAGRSDSIGTVIDNVELRSNTTTEEAGEATVTIVVDGVNDAPIAADDTASGTEADDGSFAAVTGNVLTNDSDVDLGDALTVVSADGVAAGQVINVTSDENGFAGTAVIAADGSLTVTPGSDFAALNNGESDTITITYVVSDGNGGTDEAEVVVTVNGTGEPLDIVDDSLNLLENETLNGNILDNDIAEGDLIVSSFSGLAAGETAEVVSADGRTGFITVGEDGSISFTADGDFETLAVGDSDTITFSYTAATVGGTGENLIINGDFENNPLNNTGWNVFESIVGWTSPVGLIEVQESNFQTGNTQGNAVVELDSHYAYSNATIEQTVSITDAGTYNLSVDYAARGTNFGTNGFDIVVNGEVVSEVRPNASGFQNETVELDLAAGDAVIQFRGRGTQDTIGTVIDNVELRSATTSEDVGSATVTIVVDGLNDGPVAADDTASGTEADDGSFAAVTGNVLTNDSDVDLGDLLSVVSADGVAAGQVINVTSDVNGFAGTAVIAADGSLTVTPGSDFAALNNGESDTITITYVVSDGNGGTDEAEVVVTINGAGEAFEIVDDSGNVVENETLTANVLDNDNSNEGLQVYSFAGVDAGGTATVVSADGRSGSVTLNSDGSLTFTADGDFESLAVGDTDTVTFTYAAGTGTPRGENLIENGDFESNPLANTGSTIVDAIDSWEATVGNVEVQESDHGSGNVEGNAVVELDANINSTIAQTVSIDEAGDYVFSLDYAMTGANAATNGLGVRINGVEVATEFPTTAGFQTLEVSVALAAGDAQIEIFALGDSDGVGTVIDNIALQTAGVAGQQGSAEVTIEIEGINDGPVASDDAESTNENIDDTFSDVVGNVLTNDSDVDAGDLLTVTAVNGVAGNVGQVLNVTSDQGGFAATAVIEADGSITVSPSDEFGVLGGGEVDTITLTYEVSDGNGGTDEAEVVITVNGADNGVALNNDAVSVFENSAEFINVLSNDTGGQGFAVESVEGNPAGQSFLATTVGGRELQVILLPNGTLTVAANEQFDNLAFGELDTVRLAYTAGDNSGSSAEAFVDVTIIGVNDDIRVFVDEDEPIEVNQGGVGSGQVFIVDANGERGNVDIDGDAASFSIVSQGEFVTATIDEATGEFTFTNEVFGFVGEDSFQFGASDGLSFDSGTVRVEVINVGNAPTFDAAASDLAVDASALGTFLQASGTLTAFDADDFDFTADGTQFPDDILDVEVRQGFTIEMGAGGDEEIAELVEEIFGELADGAFFVGGVDAVTREVDFNFSLDAEDFVGVILDEGLGAAELAGISFDLTYTVDINDQTDRDGFTDVTISVGTEDILGLLA